MKIIKNIEYHINNLNRILFYLIPILLISNCSNEVLPKLKLNQYETMAETKFEDGLLSIHLSNPLMCPLRIWVQSQNQDVNKYFSSLNPISLSEKKDTLFKLKINATNLPIMSFPSRYGDSKMKVKNMKISLPFKENSTYKVIQGNNSSFSHNNDYSKYSIDFNMNIGDTICAVENGFVVGVIEEYSKNGKSKEWRDYSNVLTIYHPELKLFSQYVHLKKNGSLVKLGEYVKVNQPIGLSGMTGFTDTKHLHFALLKPINSTDGLISIPIEFKEGYIGTELKKNDIVTNKK